MSWKDFLHDGEKIQTKFEYEKRNTKQVIGVSDKRGFYYQREDRFLSNSKKTESFLSSKFPIATIRYKLWTVPLWAWILNILGYILILLLIGIEGPRAENGDLETILIGSIVLLIYLSIAFIILILNRKVAKISAIIGTESVSITSRKADVRERAKNFINETHALSSIRKAKSISSFKTKVNKLILIAGTLIYIVVFIALFSIIIGVLSA
ncbi:MAG: membrane protein of unknown function [Promethearchaeota archaeon]|nr:MAG: membrane protein of unknown function [Candidatus Lokiarchaeota archaeon]